MAPRWPNSELKNVTQEHNHTHSALYIQIIVSKRIKGKLDAYLEADASKYVLDTISEGYKLIFINNQIPPSSFPSK